MENKKILDILSNYKNKSNKELTEVLDYLNLDFENTKNLIIKLTHHLDKTEESYNKVFNEFKKRVNNVK